MRHTFSHKELYNEPLKQEFLDQYKTETSKRTLKRIFHHATPLEEQKKKDLGAFSEKELEDFVMKVLKPTTFMSAKTNCHSLSLYLKFAQKKNMRSDNPFDVNQKEYAKYQTENESDLITFGDIDDITMTALANANDALIIRLLFEGAMGFELSEIANLKKKDIDVDTNTITLHDDSEKKDKRVRTLVVSNGTMELIRSASIETIYRKKNGEMDENNPRIKTEVELVESEYVLRPTKNRNLGFDEGKCSRGTLYSRIRVVREVDALKSVKAKWNTKQIQRSGMLYQALKIVQQKGNLERQDYLDIAERFGVSHNWQDRNVINLETIIKVYGENYMNIDANNF